MLKMPTFTVSLDGKALASVCADGFEVLAIHISGTRVDEEFASLHMSAGNYQDGAERRHLIWIDSIALHPGQCVRVDLTQEGETSPPGKTLAELYPDEAHEPTADFKPTPEMFAELRRRKQLRAGYSIELLSPAGKVVHAHTNPENHGFGFSVLWNSYRPERASASLHTYTIDSLEQHAPVHDQMREYLEPGQSVNIQLNT